MSISCAGEGERYSRGELFVAQRVDWSNIEPIIRVECAGCHADPPQVGAPQALTTYEQVLPWISRIQIRVLEQGDMPPGGLRGEGASELLKAWIDQGVTYEWDLIAGEMIAGEMTSGEMTSGEMASGEMASGEMIDNQDPTWNEEIYPLFEIYCNTCHAQPPTGGAPFPLKTYEQSAPFLERFRVRVLERRDMPPGGITNTDHLDAIRAWIDAGGPE
jgi:uncharacterized membrane protein